MVSYRCWIYCATGCSFRSWWNIAVAVATYIYTCTSQIYIAELDYCCQEMVTVAKTDLPMKWSWTTQLDMITFELLVYAEIWPMWLGWGFSGEFTDYAVSIYESIIIIHIPYIHMLSGAFRVNFACCGRHSECTSGERHTSLDKLSRLLVLGYY